jgi:hypothetical protein
MFGDNMNRAIELAPSSPKLFSEISNSIDDILALLEIALRIINAASTTCEKQ